MRFALGDGEYIGMRTAAERFRQSVELESDYADAWNNLGNVLGQLGRYDEAVEAYRCAVSLEPDWADARFGLADLLEASGRAREAAEHWRRLLDPADGAYLGHRTDVYTLDARSVHVGVRP